MTSLGAPTRTLVEATGLLARQLEISLTFLRSIDERVTDRAYAPGKWTIKQVLGHVTDLERIFGFRAFCFARGDEGPLPSIDCDNYLKEGRFGERAFDQLIVDFASVRGATIALLRSLPPGTHGRAGVASGKVYSLEELVELLADHERHHMRVIAERYLEDPSRAASLYPEVGEP